MSLAHLSVARPVTTLMFYTGVVLLGVVAFTQLSVDFLPPIKIPRLTVHTAFPNASPEEIDQSVTQPVEAALGTVVGVKRVSSVSREGISVVTVEFYWGTDMDFAFLGVREKLDQMRGHLPREAGRPTILRIDPSTEPVMTLAVSFTPPTASMVNDPTSGDLNALAARGRGGSGITARDSQDRTLDQQSGLVELKETARALVKRRLEQIDGVAQAAVFGGLEREIRVDVDLRKLDAFGLSVDNVARALAANNVSLPGGTIKQGLFRYPLRVLGEFSDLDQIKEVVVTRTESGGTIRVRDLGEVHSADKERTGLARYNGEEIVALQVRKEAGSNTLRVSQQVREVLDQLSREYPSLQCTVLSDHAEFIGKSISDVQQAIIIGAVLAFAVLFLFLRSLRYPMIIGLTMPVSILATLVAMYFLGLTVNIISLTGLALGVGMLGDNAIIVVENVTRLREQGKGLVEATIEGAKEINLAVTASTLTNVAIFLPIIFVEGVASKLFVDMGVTMTISLLISLLVAVTLVPMLLSRGRSATFATGQDTGETSVPKATLFVDVLSRAAYRLMNVYVVWCLQHRAKVVIVALGLFFFSIAIALQIPSEPAPDIDQSRFTVELVMPAGMSLEGTASVTSRVEEQLRFAAGVRGVYASIGMPAEQHLSTITKSRIERSVLEVSVLEQASTRQTIHEARQILNAMQGSISGLEYTVRPRGTTFEQILRPSPTDIRIRVLGDEPAVSRRVAEQYAVRVRHIPGLVDLQSSYEETTPEFKIVVHRDRAVAVGLSAKDVAHHIAQQIQGADATSFSDFDRKITIRVRPRTRSLTTHTQVASHIDPLNEILATTIEAPHGPVPVRDLVHCENVQGSGAIWREEGQRAVVLNANVAGRTVSAVANALQREAATLQLPPGYRISIGGENEEIAESLHSLFLVILLSLFLVYMILASQYESVLYPFVILLTSPLAFVGAILAMAITGQQYNVMSLIGLVIMIGAVDNDAVIVVDVITGLRRQGYTLGGAVAEGMRRRLRPILMTTATTVLGIIPLVFEFGTGSELVRALTAPLVGGLIASTLFTITVIPVAYSYIDRWALGRTLLR